MEKTGFETSKEFFIYLLKSTIFVMIKFATCFPAGKKLGMNEKNIVIHIDEIWVSNLGDIFWLPLVAQKSLK